MALTREAMPIIFDEPPMIVPTIPLRAVVIGEPRLSLDQHRQLVRWGQRDAGGWRDVGDLLPTRATDFRPDLEFLGPEGSTIGGSDVLAAELEEVVDLVVG